jgi:hypothetical protein
MRLTESDLSLADICRSVEQRMRGVRCLQGVDLPVILLPHFNDLGLPVSPKDPTAYNRPDDAILVNALVFPSRPPEIAQFAIAHEIGHHAHDVGITTSDMGFKIVHTCLVADWLATQWGFVQGMRIEQLATRGEEFCERLSTTASEKEFLEWVVDWERRFTLAEMLGKPMRPA